jgi:hypothetical protein
MLICPVKTTSRPLKTTLAPLKVLQATKIRSVAVP